MAGAGLQDWPVSQPHFHLLKSLARCKQVLGLVKYGLKLRQQVACWQTQTCHSGEWPTVSVMSSKFQSRRIHPSCNLIPALCAVTCRARPCCESRLIVRNHVRQRCVWGSWLPVAFQQTIPARARGGAQLAAFFRRGAESPHLIKRKYHPACPKLGQRSLSNLLSKLRQLFLP